MGLIGIIMKVIEKAKKKREDAEIKALQESSKMWIDKWSIDFQEKAKEKESK